MLLHNVAIKSEYSDEPRPSSQNPSKVLNSQRPFAHHNVMINTQCLDQAFK